MNTEIISKNGSIFGKIPRKNKKTTAMSSNSSLSSYHDSDGYSSDDSLGMLSRGTYVGQSPRAAPATTSRSGSGSGSGSGSRSTRTLRERLAPPFEQTEVSAAIDRYRAQTIRAPRPAAREATSTTTSSSSSTRISRGHEYGRQQRLRELPEQRAPSGQRNLSNPGSEASWEADNSSSRSSSSSRSLPLSSSRSGATRSRSNPIYGEPSYLGPVTRDFLRSARLTRARDDGKDDRLESVEGESFFPTPKVTFMIDRPQGLTCQICQTATLEMSPSTSPSSSSSRSSSRSSSSSSSDEGNPDSDTKAVIGRGKRGATVAPAILPCGHLGCHSCLEQWVTAHHSCPFCRQEMRHKGCGHTAEPRAITQSTVHELPRTLAEGGSIGHRCRDCRIEDAQTAALRRWEELAEDLQRARRRVRMLGSGRGGPTPTGGEGRKEEMDAAKKALKQYEQAFEAAPSRSLLEKATLVDASW